MSAIANLSGPVVVQSDDGKTFEFHLSELAASRFVKVQSAKRHKQRAFGLAVGQRRPRRRR